ncbi:hypothetical protein K469DRAFT_219933 [Zopfia rhizophila CBS 207.26]|uniref:Uncharacterized protein n=1 Tax=Zopfia rhizophila CBS 207.26 TaxID=1314779 RepID=A0A6A6DXS2_9PEZI|nr:hypothetical protein K469DRAFT_219933 [Zopfia rhizophila CBS 207.26]
MFLGRFSYWFRMFITSISVSVCFGAFCMFRYHERRFWVSFWCMDGRQICVYPSFSVLFVLIEFHRKFFKFQTLKHGFLDLVTRLFYSTIQDMLEGHLGH